jgi:hypothetical protein
MQKMFSALSILLGISILNVTLTTKISAQEVAFVKVSEKRNKVVLRNCNIIDGVKTLTVSKGNLILPRKLNRKPLKLTKPYTHFACGENSTGGESLFAKVGANGEITQYDLTLKNFPVNETTGNLGKNCQQVQSFPSYFIYKTIGSDHFTDIRRNSIGLIVKPGIRASWPSCVDVINKNGESVAKIALFAVGNGWSARFYAGIGCGSSTALNGTAVAQEAKKGTQSTDIYFDFGDVCFGPVDASKCVGSSSC